MSSGDDAFAGGDVREDRGLGGGHGEVVAAGVDRTVMEPAEQGQVLHVGVALAAPPDDVVGVGQCGATIAAGEGAVPIADGQGPALGAVGQAGRAAAVEVGDDRALGGAEL